MQIGDLLFAESKRRRTFALGVEMEIVNTPIRFLPPAPIDQVSSQSSLAFLSREIWRKKGPVFVDGYKDSGKTVFLRDLYLSGLFPAVGLFLQELTTSDEVQHTVSFELKRQMWSLQFPDKEMSESVIQEDVRVSAVRFKRYVSNTKQKAIIIIDGIEQLSTTELKELFSWVYTEDDSIRLVFSGDDDAPQIEDLRARSFFFRQPEASEVFQKYGFNPSTITDLRQLVTNHPNLLWTVARLLRKGLDIETVLSADEKDVPALEFRDIWTSPHFSKNSIQEMVSLIAHSSRLWRIADLAGVFGCEPGQVRATLQAWSFLEIREDVIRWVSRTAKDYAKEKTVGSISKARQKHLDYWRLLTRETAGAETLAEQFQGSNDEGPLSLLSPKNQLDATLLAESMLAPDNNRSRFQLEKIMSVLVTTAERAENIRLSLFYTLLHHIVSSCARHEITVSRLNSLISLNQFDEAVALAYEESKPDQRLLLLATAASKLTKIGKPLDVTVKADIFHLVSESEKFPVDLGLRIASEMMLTDSKLAISVAEKLDIKGGEDLSLDGVFASLALMSNLGAISPEVGNGNDATEKITNSRLRTMAELFSLSLQPIGGEELLRRLRLIDKTADCILIIRSWIVNPRQPDSLALVLNYGLDRITEDANYTPSPSGLVELAGKIQELKSVDKVNILTRFEQLLMSSQKYSPTQDWLSLKCSLVRARCQLAEAEGYQAFLDIVTEIGALTHRPTERFKAAIQILQALRECQLTVDELDLMAECNKIMNSALDEILNESAIQEVNLLEGLIILSQDRLWDALSIIKSVNTLMRRESLRLACARAYYIHAETVDCKDVVSVVNAMEDWECRDQLITDCLSYLVQRDDASIIHLEELADRTSVMKDSVKKSQATCYALSLALQVPKFASGKITELKDQLRISFDSIDNPAKRIDVGYGVSSILAKSDIELANLYHKESGRLLSQRGSFSWSYFNVRQTLLVHLLDLLENRPKVFDESARTILELIQDVPGRRTKATLLSKMGLLAQRLSNKAVADLVHTALVENLMAIDRVANQLLFDLVVRASASALYAANPPRYFHILKDVIDDEYCDQGLSACLAWALFPEWRGAPGQLFSDLLKTNKVPDLDRLLKALDLLEHFRIDGNIDIALSWIAEATHFSREKQKLTKEQLGGIVAKLMTFLSSGKLPDAKNILHDGYLVNALIWVYLINEDGASPSFEEVYRRVRAVGNSADRTYLLGQMLTVSLLKRDKLATRNRAQLEEELESSIASLPFDSDRLSRYSLISERLVQLPKESLLFKKIARAAFECSKEAPVSSDRQHWGYIRRMLDMAYALDPEFAATLSTTFDQDVAKSRRARVERRLRILEQARQSSETFLKKHRVENMSSVKDEEMVDVAKILRAGIHNGRTSAPKISGQIQFLTRASQMTFKNAKVLLGFVFDAIVKRDSSEISQFVQNILKLLAKSDALMNSRALLTPEKAPAVESRIIFKPGDAESAEAYVRKWISSVNNDSLVIVDAYFKLDALHFIRDYQLSNPHGAVKVVTSHKFTEETGGISALAGAVRDFWKQNISSDSLPEVEFIIPTLADDSEKQVIHDRWVIAYDIGLKLGTSISGLGKSVHDIETLTGPSLAQARSELSNFIDRPFWTLPIGRVTNMRIPV